MRRARCYNGFVPRSLTHLAVNRGWHMPKNDSAAQNLTFPFTFGTNFLRDHAGHIISDTRVAITELIANAYDAGATAVDILWPGDAPGPFHITDNGTGDRKSTRLNSSHANISY